MFYLSNNTVPSSNLNHNTTIVSSIRQSRTHSSETDSDIEDDLISEENLNLYENEADIVDQADLPLNLTQNLSILIDSLDNRALNSSQLVNDNESHQLINSYTRTADAEDSDATTTETQQLATLPTYSFNSSNTDLVSSSARGLQIKKNLIDFAKLNRTKSINVINLVQSLSYLKPGCIFYGTQNQIYRRGIYNATASHKEQWEVKVIIKNVDFETGTIVGLMEAYNIPSSSITVETYWEGEIVDFVNFGLWTNKWKATLKTDLEHWKMFEAFEKLDTDRKLDYTNLTKEIFEKYIFMRWKEKTFVNVSASESGLTIAGFYYVCIRRDNGEIEGYYFDPNSKPYQRLYLKPYVTGNGMCFADCQYI